MNVLDACGEAALSYVARGWHVIPIHWSDPSRPGGCSCGKLECSSPGKHPVAQLVPQGLKNATLNPQVVRDWWGGPYRKANVGIVTGEASGLVVLDVDPKNGGTGSLENLLREHGDFRGTLTQRTGSGGLHFLFRHPGFPVRNSAGAVGTGLDVRGDGGYIVAAPSNHASGGTYAWVEETAALLPMPHWLAAPTADRATAANAPREVGHVIPSGQQHYTLVSVAGTMRRRGLPENVIAAALHEMNETMLERPAPRANIARIAADAAKWEPEEALDLAAYAGRDDVEDGMERLGDVMAREYERLGELLQRGGGLPGIATDLDGLDSRTGGLHRGELIAIAGRPSHGKSALGMAIARNIALRGEAVGVFSLEMTKAAVARRLMAAASGVDSMRLRLGTFDAQDLTALAGGIGKLYDAPFYLADRSNVTVSGMRRYLLSMELPPAAVFVDYLQLVQGEAKSGRHFNREDEEIAAVSSALKGMAKEFDVPVVALVQLNRDLEKRGGMEKRPRLSDLRGSGQIEQDLDVALMLWRPERYEITHMEYGARTVETDGLAEVVIAKQREGVVENFLLSFDKATVDFKDYRSAAALNGHHVPF